jgi:hypothetical protein
LEEKWNLEGRFDILVTEICFVNLMSCLLSSNDSMSQFKNGKYWVINTLDFKNFPVDSISQTLKI